MERISQNPSTLEGKFGITAERIKEYGEIILAIIQDVYSRAGENKLLRRWAEGYIAGFLQRRLSKEQAAQFKKIFKPEHLRHFDKIVAIARQNFELKGEYRVELGEGDNYLQISNPSVNSKFGNKRKTKQNQEITVFNKEYFTFTPMGIDLNEILVEASRFYGALFFAYTRLQDIARANAWSVSMKFKSNIEDLLDDLDGAVFYVSNEDAGKVARQVVREEMKKVKLSTERAGRAETGFDVRLPNGETYSHRQLIAKAVAKVINDDYLGARKIASYRPEDFGQSILSRANQAGRLTPEQIVEAIK